jgi:hypothetical protein
MPLEIIEDINQVLESLSSAAYAGGSTSTSKTALTDDVVALLKRIKKEAKDF